MQMKLNLNKCSAIYIHSNVSILLTYFFPYFPAIHLRLHKEKKICVWQGRQLPKYRVVQLGRCHPRMQTNHAQYYGFTGRNTAPCQ